MTRDLRPMGIGDILDTAFNLYKRRFATFATISLVVYVPYALAMAALTFALRSLGAPQVPSYDPSFWSRATTDVSPLRVSVIGAGRLGFGAAEHALLGAGVPAFGAAGLSLAALIVGVVATVAGILLFFGLVYPLCAGALIVNISALYLGRELSARESYRRAFQRLGTMLGAQGLAGLCVFAGTLLCVVPGIVAMLWFMLVTPVTLIEDTSSLASLKRSRDLMGGNLGKGFWLLFVVGLLGFAVFAVMGFVVRLVPWPAEFLADFIANLAPALMLPLSIGCTVLLYYDLRIRKEGFDLTHLATRMADLNAHRNSQRYADGA